MSEGLPQGALAVDAEHESVLQRLADNFAHAFDEWSARATSLEKHGRSFPPTLGSLTAASTPIQTENCTVFERRRHELVFDLARICLELICGVTTSWAFCLRRRG